MLQILAISGSLRKASSNTALLRAAAALAPVDVKISLCKSLGDLPHFNPDLEGVEPASVLEFRSQLLEADGVMIASPEYMHGITGVMKNALDWIAGSGEFVGKPVALLNASQRSSHAQASLKEVIKTIDARIIEEASVTIPLPHNKFDEADIVAHPELSSLLSAAIEAFVSGIKSSPAPFGKEFSLS